jgi:hypothetical protein
MHRRRLQEDLRRPSPQHNHAIHRLLERLNIGNHLHRQIALVLALLDMRAVQPLHIVLIEDRRHRLDRFQKRLDLRQMIVVQHLGMSRRLVNVVVKNIPAGKDNIVQARQRHKVLDQRRIAIRALAQPNRAHLRQRTDRLRQSLANRLNPAINVVATAPMPTTITPNLPCCRRNLLCRLPHVSAMKPSLPVLLNSSPWVPTLATPKLSLR